MKRALIALTTGAAVLALSAPAASGSLVNRTIEKCEADATWDFTLNLSGPSHVDVSYDTGPTGCRAFEVFVDNNGDFSVSGSDDGRATSVRLNLTGVGAIGLPAFAGVANYAGRPDLGPVVIDGTNLSATMTAVSPDGYHVVAQYTGTGKCGTHCYTAHGVWESGRYPGP